MHNAKDCVSQVDINLAKAMTDLLIPEEMIDRPLKKRKMAEDSDKNSKYFRLVRFERLKVPV